MERGATTAVDVLIVGAGPVGLLLANECARRHLTYRIIEQHPTQSEHSKALAIFPRTLEILDMAGLARPFLEAANRVTSAVVMARGRTLAHVPFSPEDTPYPFIAMVPQDVTERLLVERLVERSGAVEYQTALISFEQSADHVTAVLQRDGRLETTTAAFLVGCDGAHSRVRHLLELSFAGGEYAELFMLADVDIEATGAVRADTLYLCPHEQGPLAIFPISATRKRIVATVHDTGDTEPSMALVRTLIDERGPAGINATHLHWSSFFRVHHRHVSQMRKGRVFVAGDAAHIHSPFGGQGMNTGLHDAWNLVWKLDLALQGRGNDRLLDSYTDERIPVIRDVIKTTDRITRIMGAPSKTAQMLRDLFAPIVSKVAPIQHAIVRRLSELDIGYPDSTIVDGEATRYFDDTLRGGSGILSKFVLLVNRHVAVETEDAARALASSFERLVELRYSDAPGVTLVRPDGYIAWSGSGRDGRSWVEARSLIEQQTARMPG